MSATIKDIAAATGVSRGTVDRALHDRPGVSRNVAEMVRRVADDLDFKPNRAGKMLAARKQPLKVGCFYPGKENRFFDDVAAGFIEAGERLAHTNLSVLLKTSARLTAADHIAAIEGLLDYGCGALCVTTVDTPDMRRYINGVIDNGVPVVTVNTDLSGTRRLCYVGCDYAQGGCTAAGLMLLMIRGRLDLLVVAGSLDIKGHAERVDGFVTRLRQRGAQFNVVDVVESQDKDETAYVQTIAALRKSGEVNGIYVASAASAGVCRAVSELGLSAKIRIVTHDDTPSVRHLLRNGAIDATLTQEPYMQGFAAVELLAGYFMDGKKESPHDFITPTAILIGENLG